jgi:hypothetical protein
MAQNFYNFVTILEIILKLAWIVQCFFKTLKTPFQTLFNVFLKLSNTLSNK